MLTEAELLNQHAMLAGMKMYVLPVRNACNARCVFCATTVYNPMIDEASLKAELYVSMLERLRFIEFKAFEFTGGGEPTLCKDLASLVEITRDFYPKARIKLYSNGLKLLLNPGINELNLSCASVFSDENVLLMGIPRKLAFSVKDVIQEAREKGYERIRISIPLCRGGVDSYEKIKEAVRILHPYVDAIVFRPLYDATPERSILLPDITENDYRRIRQWISTWNFREGSTAFVELDETGMLRRHWMILAADGHIYNDFGLKDRII